MLTASLDSLLKWNCEPLSGSVVTWEWTNLGLLPGAQFIVVFVAE
jgi:hypothetical protein